MGHCTIVSKSLHSSKFSKHFLIEVFGTYYFFVLGLEEQEKLESKYDWNSSMYICTDS